MMFVFFFFQAEDGIRDYKVTGVQTCALPIYYRDKDHFELTFHYRGTLPFTQNALPVPLDNSNTRIPNYSYIARFNFDHTFSPALLNHFAVGYLDLVSEVYNSSDGAVHAVPSVPGVYSTAHVPAINIDRKSTRLNSSHLV